MSKGIRNLTLSAMFIALGLLLPFLTGQIPQIGRMLSPMHIPVLLCGLICGWKYGLAVGFITPVLRSFVFGMPAPLYPNALAMGFELCTYGLVVGLLYCKLRKHKIVGVYCSMIPAMLVGRAVWGVAMLIMLGLGGTPFTLEAFLAGAFVNAVPAIILQLVLIPAIMAVLDRAGLVRYSDTN